MKVCAHCGHENEDDLTFCRACASEDFITSPSATPPSQTDRPAWEFHDLTPEEREQDMLTLVTCRSLGEADLVVSELAAAGIEAFIPDEFQSQTLAPPSFAAVRVQVAAKDYELAKAFLSAVPESSEPGNGNTGRANDPGELPV